MSAEESTTLRCDSRGCHTTLSLSSGIVGTRVQAQSHGWRTEGTFNNAPLDLCPLHSRRRRSGQ